MSGTPFQIASMDENGILNMWVSNTCMKREHIMCWNNKILLQIQQLKSGISDENFLHEKYSETSHSVGILLKSFDLTS